MSSEIRSFRLTDDATDEERSRIAAFLRTVDVRRIDTAYVDGAWHILILFQDLRHREESAQIASAITVALNAWRDRIGAQTKQARDQVLPDRLIPEIARFAPTTERELLVLAAGSGDSVSRYGSDIVAIVRETMASLID